MGSGCKQAHLLRCTLKVWVWTSIPPGPLRRDLELSSPQSEDVRQAELCFHQNPGRQPSLRRISVVASGLVAISIPSSNSSSTHVFVRAGFCFLKSHAVTFISNGYSAVGTASSLRNTCCISLCRTRWAQDGPQTPKYAPPQTVQSWNFIIKYVLTSFRRWHQMWQRCGTWAPPSRSLLLVTAITNQPLMPFFLAEPDLASESFSSTMPQPPTYNQVELVCETDSYFSSLAYSLFCSD